MQYNENPYHPFPLEMRGQFCEFVDNGNHRFIKIYSIKYDVEKLAWLKKRDCLYESELYEYISMVGEQNINKNTFYLYKLCSYIGNPMIKDSWAFAESTLDYQQYGFSSFNDLINFCYEKWKIKFDDFVSLESTHIP